MRELARRAVLAVGIGIGIGLAVCGCANRTGGSGETGTVGPRLRHAVGETRTPARLVVEVDNRRKPVGPATLHTFNLVLEERIDSVDGGEASVQARMLEAVGASGEPQLSDKLALALDELKVSFRRTTRGEVRDLKIDGLRAPLDENTARAIVSTLFGAGRGPCLPDRNAALQDDWTVETDDDVVGLTAHLRHFYTLLEKRTDAVRVRAKGRVEAIGSLGSTRRHLEGETFSDEILDLRRGIVLSGEYEWSVTVDDDPPGDLPGAGRTKIRAERGLAAKK
jgi:hypothetical protein